MRRRTYHLVSLSDSQTMGAKPKAHNPVGYKKYPQDGPAQKNPTKVPRTKKKEREKGLQVLERYRIDVSQISSCIYPVRRFKVASTDRGIQLSNKLTQLSSFEPEIPRRQMDQSAIFR